MVIYDLNCYLHAKLGIIQQIRVFQSERMVKISVSEELSALVEGLVLCCIECDVEVRPSPAELSDLMEKEAAGLASTLTTEDISRLPAISASRRAYRLCGKDPARYRLSAEALLRRIVKGTGLYSISNVVDLLNLVSFTTGFSIGGYDADAIAGDVVFGIGCPDEMYEGVGRGVLNIEGLPVFRDSTGAFGSPTSDSERTAVNSLTGRFLMVIISFGGRETLDQACSLAIGLLEKYASAKNIEIKTIGN